MSSVPICWFCHRETGCDFIFVEPLHAWFCVDCTNKLGRAILSTEAALVAKIWRLSKDAALVAKIWKRSARGRNDPSNEQAMDEAFSGRYVDLEMTHPMLDELGASADARTYSNLASAYLDTGSLDEACYSAARTLELDASSRIAMAALEVLFSSRLLRSDGLRWLRALVLPE